MTSRVRSEEQTAYNADPTFSKKEDELIAKALQVLDKRLKARRDPEGLTIVSSTDTMAYCKLKYASENREVFSVLFLDTRHRLIKTESLFFGTIDQASVYPREILKKALEYNAAAVILTHNHPSGKTDPSMADIMFTAKIAEALRLVDIRVLDHIITGEGEPCSMSVAGHI